MGIDYSEINFLDNPETFSVKADYMQFLLSISGPTVIDISGLDQTRTRVITTLIHGNEPSGLMAIHRWITNLSATQRPVTNLRFIICSPEAAAKSPHFSHRFLDDGKDLNRCFSSTQTDGYYLRAQYIKDAINEVSPEAVFDIHNTSGIGPAFAVVTEKSELALSYTSLFCHSLILSDIKLGALMEQDFDCQVITIECGGANDQQSHEVAYEGICHIAQIENIGQCHHIRDVDVFLKPLRLQLSTDIELNYAKVDEGYPGVTLLEDIEQINFSTFRKGHMLGWVDSKGLDNFKVMTPKGNNVTDEYFALRGNQVISKIDLDIFMATRIEKIAKSDCILYLVPHKNHM